MSDSFVWKHVSKSTRKCNYCQTNFGDKTGTGSIATHLKIKHSILPDVIRQLSGDKRAREQANVWFGQQFPKSASAMKGPVAVYRRKVTLGLVLNDIPFNKLTKDSFKMMLEKNPIDGTTPSIDTVKAEIKTTKQDIITIFQSRLKGKFVSICGDGGKNCRRDKLCNITLRSEGWMLFWKSAVVDVSATGKEYLRIFVDNLKAIEETFECIVAQIVTDNASAIVLGADMLKLLLCYCMSTKCCAHSLQLLVGDLNKEFPQKLQQAEILIKKIEMLFNSSAGYTQRRNALANLVKSDDSLHDLTTVGTISKNRWGARLDLGKKIIKLEVTEDRRYISSVLVRGEIDNCNHQIQTLLPQYVKVFEPLQEATTKLESDTSSLHDLATIMKKLETHIEDVSNQRLIEEGTNEHNAILKEIFKKRHKQNCNEIEFTAIQVLSPHLWLYESGQRDKLELYTREVKAYIINFGSYLNVRVKKGFTYRLPEIQFLPEEKEDVNGGVWMDDTDEEEIANLKIEIENQLTSYMVNEDKFKINKGETTYNRYWRMRERSGTNELAYTSLAMEQFNTTETSVERNFSHDGIIHSKQRYSMEHSNVDDLIFLKMNAGKIYKELINMVS